MMTGASSFFYANSDGSIIRSGFTGSVVSLRSNYDEKISEFYVYLTFLAMRVKKLSNLICFRLIIPYNRSTWDALSEDLGTNLVHFSKQIGVRIITINSQKVESEETKEVTLLLKRLRYIDFPRARLQLDF